MKLPYFTWTIKVRMPKLKLIMQTKITSYSFIVSLILLITSKAAVVATLNFDDTIWTQTFTETGGNNDSIVAGGTITADKSGSAGGVQIRVTLNGSISTLGFENITLGFDGSTVGVLEWDASGGGAVTASDGIHIVGSGVTIDSNGISGTTAATDFTNGSTFPTSNFGSDFAFDTSVDNSAINSLTFTVRVNAGPEEISLSNVQILGNVVPEPSSVLLLTFGSIALLAKRRR